MMQIEKEWHGLICFRKTSLTAGDQGGMGMRVREETPLMTGSTELPPVPQRSERNVWTWGRGDRLDQATLRLRPTMD